MKTNLEEALAQLSERQRKKAIEEIGRMMGISPKAGKEQDGNGNERDPKRP